jgi:hypothetical protein
MAWTWGPPPSASHPRLVHPLQAILTAGVSATVFLFYSNALSKLGRTQSRISAYFFWFLFIVYVPFGLLVALFQLDSGFGTGVISAALTSELGLLIWTGASGWWALFKLDEPTRRILTSPFEGVISRAAIRTYSGLPPIIEFVRSDG